ETNCIDSFRVSCPCVNESLGQKAFVFSWFEMSGRINEGSSKIISEFCAVKYGLGFHSDFLFFCTFFLFLLFLFSLDGDFFLCLLLYSKDSSFLFPLFLLLFVFSKLCPRTSPILATSVRWISKSFSLSFVL